MSPTELFAGTPYFVVFWLAISWSISLVFWSTFPNPKVRMTTELFSWKFMSLIVWNIGPSSSLSGASSVRNNITFLVLGFPSSSETEAFRRLKAFSKPVCIGFFLEKEKISKTSLGELKRSRKFHIGTDACAGYMVYIKHPINAVGNLSHVTCLIITCISPLKLFR